MLLELLRVKQYYKNLLVFLPLLFAGLFFDDLSLLLSLLGFISLCLMSSANYILNDILDREKDKFHPEKSLRPVCSGKISVFSASVIALVCASISLTIGILLSAQFFYILLIIFILTQLYSLYFKNEIFLDILFISINFVLRAVSGSYILGVRISPWLIVCTFFLSLLIALGKRKSDYNLLKIISFQHKKVLLDYTPELTNTLLIISTTSLMMSYSLYSFLSIYPHLIYTLPLALYVILRYFYLIENNSIIARQPERFYTDVKLLLGIILWLIAVVVIMY
jgi:4-hydroxybenzoate polyprenyltransferase